jgi:hypothetical protein
LYTGFGSQVNQLPHDPILWPVKARTLNTNPQYFTSACNILIVEYSKRSTPRNIIVKLVKGKNKEKSLENSRRKRTYLVSAIRLTPNF